MVDYCELKTHLNTEMTRVVPTPHFSCTINLFYRDTEGEA